jgi:hypothetical protein
MRIISASIGPLQAASANNIATAQSGTGGTALTLAANTVDSYPRRIIITCVSDESSKTFLVRGLDWSGTPVTESIAGATAGNATSSLYDYTYITSIVPSANTTGNVSVGTVAANAAATRPIFLDEFGFAPTALQVNITNTASITVQQSLDDPNAVGFVNVKWVNHPDSNLVAASSTAGIQGNYAYAPKVVRLLVNSGCTGSSSVTLRVSQAASVPF